MLKNIALLLLLLNLSSCKEASNARGFPEDYNVEIEAYWIDRTESRKGNYLQLIGLFKLDSLNTFGKSPENKFVLSATDIPDNIGTIAVNDTIIHFYPESNMEISDKDGTAIIDTRLNLDEFGSSVRMYHKHLNWQIITRSGSLYLRVWDEKNPAIQSFKGFEYYDLNPEMIFTGKFTYYETQKTESVKSQLGVNANTNFIGKITFQYKGETHDLDVGSNGFTMVADATTGDNSYGGGRYIYLELPKENGTVEIDFNKLYNPPCSFSDFTTCLYPPRQNHLPFAIMAGETITSTN